MKFSLFENTWDTIPKTAVTYQQVFKRIQSGGNGLKEQIEKIRELKRNGDPQYKEEKKKLMAVTFSGLFSERAASKIEEYSGLLCVDIDDLEENQIKELKEKFKHDKYILGAFLSPSGDGLKVLLWSPDSSTKYHQQFYFTAERYFRDNYEVDIDRSCKDVCRLCYISYDADAFLSVSVSSFPVDFNIKPTDHFLINTYSATGTAVNQDHKRCFRVAKAWTERIFMFEEGQRNKYIHNMACSLNRLGVPMDVCIELIDANFVTPDKKWYQSVASAYKHNAAQYGTVALKAFDPKQEEAIPYEEKPFQFGDVEREIRRIVVSILSQNFPPDTIKSIVETYVLVYRNFFDKHILEEYSIKQIIDHIILKAQDEFKANELAGATPAATQSVHEAGKEVEEILSQPSEFVWGIKGIDAELNGLAVRGNVIGVIGREKTFKSIVIHGMAHANAVEGIYSLYANGEMSKVQFIKRSVKIDSGVDFDHYLSQKLPVPKDVYAAAMESLKNNTGDRMQLHSGKNFNKKTLGDAIRKHRAEGKDIKIVFIDGLSQWEDSKNDEIKSAIFNAGECKELAKELNVLVVVLVHMRSGVSKSIRDTGEYIRGGNKVTANFDAYIATSLFEIQQADDSKEPEYRKGMFHLLLNDKRGALDIIKKVIFVDSNLRLEMSEKDPQEYEL